jgi:hypothetical protein
VTLGSISFTAAGQSPRRTAMTMALEGRNAADVMVAESIPNAVTAKAVKRLLQVLFMAQLPREHLTIS